MSANAVCPYCRTAVVETESDFLLCPGCGTPHHSDCFEENGGCTVFGCSAAPANEPKLSISAPDLEAANQVAAVYPAVGASRPVPPPPPPPPPRPGAAGNNSASFYTPQLFSSTGYCPPQSPAPWAAAPVFRVDPTFLNAQQVSTRNRTTYQLLGVFLGPLGMHNFYAGFNTKALVQLLITVFTFGIAGFMVWIWALIDICTVTKDYDGLPFRI